MRTCEYVNSTNLRIVCYDPDSGFLDITFRSGGVYCYYGVPIGVYIGLMQAGSKGSYHVRYIKNRYRYSRIG